MHYIYLIQLREFLSRSVYKIGKMVQEPHKRMNAYPKGSKIILILEVPDCHLSEKKLLTSFKIKYRHCTEFGQEYFEGSKDSMIDDIVIESKSTTSVPLPIKKRTVYDDFVADVLNIQSEVL